MGNCVLVDTQRNGKNSGTSTTWINLTSLNSSFKWIQIVNVMYILPHYVQHTFARWPQRSEKGVGSSGTGVTDGCEPPCKCWELNLGPLQEQQVFLTTKLSLESHLLFLTAPAHSQHPCLIFMFKMSFTTLQALLWEALTMPSGISDFCSEHRSFS